MRMKVGAYPINIKSSSLPHALPAPPRPDRGFSCSIHILLRRPLPVCLRRRFETARFSVYHIMPASIARVPSASLWRCETEFRDCRGSRRYHQIRRNQRHSIITLEISRLGIRQDRRRISSEATLAIHARFGGRISKLNLAA